MCLSWLKCIPINHPCDSGSTWITPPKIHIEPEHDGLEDVFPFPRGQYSQVPSHRIHVWYIYLDLVAFLWYMQVNIPVTWILWACSSSAVRCILYIDSRHKHWRPLISCFVTSRRVWSVQIRGFWGWWITLQGEWVHIPAKGKKG